MSRPQLILADLHPRGQETPRGLLASCLSCFFKRSQSKTVDLLNAAEVEDVEVTGHFFVFLGVFFSIGALQSRLVQVRHYPFSKEENSA